MNGTRSSVTIVSREPKRSLAVWDGGGDGKEDAFEDEWGVPGSCRDFLDAIEGRLDHRARLDWDINTLRVGLLAAESARQGVKAGAACRARRSQGSSQVMILTTPARTAGSFPAVPRRPR